MVLVDLGYMILLVDVGYRVDVGYMINLLLEDTGCACFMLVTRCYWLMEITGRYTML